MICIRSVDVIKDAGALLSKIGSILNLASVVSTGQPEGNLRFKLRLWVRRFGNDRRPGIFFSLPDAGRNTAISGDRQEEGLPA